jgi:hypothetical protein
VRVVLALLLHHQCRQAPQGAGAVDPELPRAIVVENLKSPPRDAFLSVYAD